MRETSKCYGKRLSVGHFGKYLKGRGIDVGCGDDPLAGPDLEVDPWDVAQGDAQMMATVPDGKYDFVYSSHCLEHLRSPVEALENWERIVRPGGFLYVVVPDYLLYEKLSWPSDFNGDHKNSFSLDLDAAKVGRPNHWRISDLVAALRRSRPEIELREAFLEDDGFDYSRGKIDQTMGNALSQICLILERTAAE